VRLWTRFILPRKGTSGGPLQTVQWTPWEPQKAGNARLDKWSDKRGVRYTNSLSLASHYLMLKHTYAHKKIYWFIC
jgi:hypothetical protein